MNRIIKSIAIWLIERYLPGFHLHRDPSPKKGMATMTRGDGE